MTFFLTEKIIVVVYEQLVSILLLCSLALLFDQYGISHGIPASSRAIFKKLAKDPPHHSSLSLSLSLSLSRVLLAADLSQIPLRQHPLALLPEAGRPHRPPRQRSFIIRQGREEEGPEDQPDG